MKQQVKVVGQTQEYPGTITWYQYAVKCPECSKWSGDYGDVSWTDPDGHVHHLCTPCGDEVFPLDESADER